MASAVAAEVSASAVLANTSTRTLILGIDKAGRIRQHDRGAGDVLAGGVLAGEPSPLIGVELASLLATSSAISETIPPSLVLITIGSVTNISIVALFTGGLLPAAVAALGLVAFA